MKKNIIILLLYMLISNVFYGQIKDTADIVYIEFYHVYYPKKRITVFYHYFIDGNNVYDGEFRNDFNYYSFKQKTIWEEFIKTNAYKESNSYQINHQLDSIMKLFRFTPIDSNSIVGYKAIRLNMIFYTLPFGKSISDPLDSILVRPSGFFPVKLNLNDIKRISNKEIEDFVIRNKELILKFSLNKHFYHYTGL